MLYHLQRELLGPTIFDHKSFALDLFHSDGLGQSKEGPTRLDALRPFGPTLLLERWIIPVLCYSAPLLLRLGQHADVAQLAAAYNRTTAPALFCLFQYQAFGLAKTLPSRLPCRLETGSDVPREGQNLETQTAGGPKPGNLSILLMFSPPGCPAFDPQEGWRLDGSRIMLAETSASLLATGAVELVVTRSERRIRCC